MTSTFKKGLWQEIGKPLQTKYLKLLGFERRLFSLNILPFEGKATGVFSSLSTRNLVQQSTDQSPPYTHPPTRHLPLSVGNFSYISSIQPPQTSSDTQKRPWSWSCEWKGDTGVQPFLLLSSVPSLGSVSHHLVSCFFYVNALDTCES